MNYKMILVSALLTFACSSAVFTQDQSAKICQNPSNEQTHALCEKIAQLQTEVAETQKVQAQDGNNQTSVNDYVKVAVFDAAVGIAYFVDKMELAERINPSLFLATAGGVGLEVASYYLGILPMIDQEILHNILYGIIVYQVFLLALEARIYCKKARHRAVYGW